jgi:biopolymer transport protein ExbD
VELSLPSSNSGGAVQEPSFRVEVVVRDAGLELTNGTDVIAAIPKVDEEYDLETLSQYLLSLKRDYPDENDASVLLEPDIPYDYLIQVMDTVRSAELPLERVAEEPDAPQFQRVALFTDIAIGEAP